MTTRTKATIITTITEIIYHCGNENFGSSNQTCCFLVLDNENKKNAQLDMACDKITVFYLNHWERTVSESWETEGMRAGGLRRHRMKVNEMD